MHVVALLKNIIFICVEVWVFGQDLGLGKVEALEEEVGRCLAHLVRRVTGKQFSRLKFKVFLVLFLGFRDLVLEVCMFKFCTVSLELLDRLLPFILLEFQYCVVQVGLKSHRHVWQLSLHRGVPVVLNGVVGAADEYLGDVRPPVVEQAVHQEENPLLFAGPAAFLDLGV